MNIDFGQDPTFSTYIVLLIFTGVAMMIMASIGRVSRGLRLLNGVLGIAFLVYGLYLGFFFQGGSYIIFFKAFILPALLAFRTLRDALRNRRPAAEPTAAAPAENLAGPAVAPTKHQ